MKSLKTAVMKLKKKINLNLYFYSLKQLIIPATVIGIVCVVASILNMFQADVNLPVYSVEIFIGQHFSKFYNGQPIAAAIAPALIIFMYVGSFVFTYLSFKHLNSRTSSDFYHSLPTSRISSYISRILAVLTWQYGIIILTMAVSIFTMKGSGISYDASFIPRLIMSYMAGSTLIVGVLALAMSFTGNIVSNSMMALVILVLPRTLLFIADKLIISANYYGFINISTMGMLLNPVYNIPTAVLLDLTRTWEYYGLSETLISTGAALYSFALGIIYLGLGLFAMKRRKSELAGNGVQNNIMRHVLSALVTLPFLAAGFHVLVKYGVINLPSSSAIQQMVMFLLIGFIVFIISQFILKRQIKSALKSFPVFIITTVLAFALVFAQKEFALSKNNEVPELNEIEYIKLDNSGAIKYKYKPLYSYTNLLTKEIEYEDEKLIGIFRDNLSRMVQTYDARRKDKNVDLNRSSEIYCEFKLKNGKSIYRNVYLYPETKEDIWKLVSCNPDYKKLSVELPSAEDIDDINIYTNLIMNESYKSEFYEHFKNEFDELPTVIKNDIINTPYSSLYNKLIPGYYETLTYTHINNFTVDGNFNGYNFKSSFIISSRVPEAAEFYMQEINTAARKQFLSDLEKIKTNNKSGSDYFIRLEVLNFNNDGLSPHRSFEFSYAGNNNENNFLNKQEFSEMLSLFDEKDLNNVDFNSPIAIVTIRKEDVDPDYSLYYHVYAQLSMADAEKLFETYVELYN